MGDNAFRRHMAPAPPADRDGSPWLLFVTGAPGAGKSSIVRALLSAAPIRLGREPLLVFDADWLLEPTSELTGRDMTTAGDLWPAYRRVWLRVLEMVARNGCSAVLFTPSAPRELRAASLRIRTDTCLLDCDEATRTARLEERRWPRGEIEEALSDAAELRRGAAHVIDTTHTSPRDAAAQLLAWLTSRV